VYFLCCMSWQPYDLIEILRFQLSTLFTSIIIVQLYRSVNNNEYTTCQSHTKIFHNNKISYNASNLNFAQDCRRTLVHTEGIYKHQQFKKKSIITALNTMQASVYTQTT
jgi:hypothetical protein